MILLPPGIQWPLSGTLSSFGVRRLDWSWTFSNLHHYLRDRGVHSAPRRRKSVEIGPNLRLWSPSLYPYPWESGGAWVVHFLVRAAGASIGAEHFLQFSITGYRGWPQRLGAGNRFKLALYWRPGPLPKLGTRLLDWSWTFSHFHYYLRDRGGALRASTQEIVVNLLKFGALFAILLPLPPGIWWRLGGTVPSLGTRRLDWMWTFSLLSIYLG